MLKYKIGDLTKHNTPKSVIAHCVNDIIRMGSGVALALLKKWPAIRNSYYEWGDDGFYYDGLEKVPFVLGQIQLIEVGNDLQVCNLIGQRDIQYYKDIPPVRYQSVLEGMYRLRDWMEDNKYVTLAIPRICCGLAGGEWKHIETILNRVFSGTNINIIVYDIEPIEGTTYVQ